MKILRPLALASAVVLAGCASPSIPTDDPTGAARPTFSASAPEPETTQSDGNGGMAGGGREATAQGDSTGAERGGLMLGSGN